MHRGGGGGGGETENVSVLGPNCQGSLHSRASQLFGRALHFLCLLLLGPNFSPWATSELLPRRRRGRRERRPNAVEEGEKAK